jgi:hypothetical protein
MVNDENSRIRIHTKMSWIRNTGLYLISNLVVYPGLDGDAMLGEYPGLEELVHAVDRQEAGHISRQVLRHRHLP